MGINRLTGTPWHVEKATRGIGDPKRHKSRCVYYRKSDSYCTQLVGKCGGSAHCKCYIEVERPLIIEDNEEKRVPKNLNKSVNQVEQVAESKKKDESIDVKNTFHVNQRVYHMFFGLGTITSIVDKYLIVDFDNGKKTKLGINICIDKKLLITNEYDTHFYK